MITTFNFELFKKRLNLFLEKIEDLGGEVEPLTIEKPATEEEVKAVEAQLGYTLPPHFREVLLENTAHLEFGWDIDDIIDEEDISLPDKLVEIFRGKLLFGLDLLLDYEEDRQDWEGEAYPNSDKEYDRVWLNKMSFFQVGNGDYIAIELEPENYGKVVYLSHDGSENHGLYIADNFKEFLMNYAAVGCTGGEDWQWEPFYTKGKGIDPTSKNAKTWYKVLGINPKELEG
ncbi:SMI1/KNR4 family protein [Capnocytophaga sputigena]|uniref:SMI1/KNR4 family protein n=1 Tax=Capnocytophaga sputigena TaxID=1019 RepID=UPI0028D0BBE6|nr:SMI1/KNR4 family protein [Capnocytophaga sputigena]